MKAHVESSAGHIQEPHSANPSESSYSLCYIKIMKMEKMCVTLECCVL